MALGVVGYVDHNGALRWGTRGWHWKENRIDKEAISKAAHKANAAGVNIDEESLVRAVKWPIRKWFGKRLPSGVRFRDPAKPVTYRSKGERVKPSQEPRAKHTRTQKRREDKWFKAKRRLAHKRSQRKSYPNPLRAHPRWHRNTMRITWEKHACGSEWKGAIPGVVFGDGGTQSREGV